MHEVLQGLYHWTTFHEGIGEPVHSYYLACITPAVVIDPRVPDEGLEWFDVHAPPRHIFLTNRLHYRHSDRFQERFGATVWCHRAGLHHFDAARPVTPFDHGDALPGGLLALAVGVLCPEETAFHVPCAEGLLAVGDAIIREDGELGFVPDGLMGDDPEGVKRGLKAAFKAHVNVAFDHLLFAHGDPWIGGAKAGLRDFLRDAGG